jgi:hypothetical protein
MATYVAIVGGYVGQVIVAATPPATPPGYDSVVDVSLLNPQPSTGWYYNGGVFTVQPIVIAQATRDVIGDVQGLIIFNTDQGEFEYNDGGSWVAF